MTPLFLPIAAWVEAIINNDKRAFSKAITLIESEREADNDHAITLLNALEKHRKFTPSFGVAGPPGVGKSSFLEHIGLELSHEHRLALLTIDPASHTGSGAILGDKTRMQYLSVKDNVFIRPSPSSLGWGGIAKKTKDVMALCEAANFDYIIIESVGAGQNDVLMAHLVDIFLLLLQPAAGDDLQAVKRGIMELADFFIITKSDHNLLASAKKAKANVMAVLSLLRQSGAQDHIYLTSIMQQHDADVSSYEAIMHDIIHYINTCRQDGSLWQKRQANYQYILEHTLKESLYNHVMASGLLQDMVNYDPSSHASYPSISAIDNLVQRHIKHLRYK